MKSSDANWFDQNYSQDEQNLNAYNTLTVTAKFQFNEI